MSTFVTLPAVRACTVGLGHHGGVDGGDRGAVNSRPVGADIWEARRLVIRLASVIDSGAMVALMSPVFTRAPVSAGSGRAGHGAPRWRRQALHGRYQGRGRSQGCGCSR